jgi:hypothetical protein
VKRLLNGTAMKLVRTKSGAIGLHVELPGGAHVVDIANSFGVFAAHDPVSAALLKGVLDERAVWVALVNHWDHLRKPLALLARTAVADPSDPRLVLHPFAHAEQTQNSSPGILALDIIDAPDVDGHDPAEPRDTRSFCMSATEDKVVDFRREKALRTQRD